MSQATDGGSALSGRGPRLEVPISPVAVRQQCGAVPCCDLVRELCITLADKQLREVVSVNASAPLSCSGLRAGGPKEPSWMARIVLGGALRIVATGSLLAPFSDTIFCWPFKCLPPRPRGITPS